MTYPRPSAYGLTEPDHLQELSQEIVTNSSGTLVGEAGFLILEFLSTEENDEKACLLTRTNYFTEVSLSEMYFFFSMYGRFCLLSERSERKSPSTAAGLTTSNNCQKWNPIDRSTASG